MIRVLIADDEGIVRSGVRAILASDPELEVVAEAADGREAVELAGLHSPDVALLDIRMPRLDGLGALEELKALVPRTAVVMLTTFGEDGYITRALDRGASGFLLKASDPRELVAGVRAVASGGACLSPLVARRLITELRREHVRPEAGTRVAALTAREREVLALLGGGLSNGEIARRLHLVEGTVKTHVSAIFQRLGVRNRVEAAIVAYEAGLVRASGPR
ncbi:response regulator [Actinocorallia populi]|uniref:response regulator n=1 Tax=Actinocorallia populi TaxID=2079200 RepID=UPI000D086C41|nr:response regulator transcription factor [Actinocorallia populi]